MDLCLTFYLYCILHLCVPSAETFLHLVCNESVTGILHEDATLPCKSDTTGPINITLIKLHQDQTRDEKLIFNTSENVRRGQNRIQLRCQDELHCPHDLSLIIHKTELSDNGTYQYIVRAEHGHDSKLINLIIEGPEHSETNAATHQEKPKEKKRIDVGLILSMVFLMLLIFSAMFYYKLSRAPMRRFSETSHSNLIAN